MDNDEYFVLINVLDSNTSSTNKSSFNSPEISDSKSNEEMAAIAIQRVFRIKRMRSHFQEIKQNINLNRFSMAEDYVSFIPPETPMFKPPSFTRTNKSIESLRPSLPSDASANSEQLIIPSARPIKKSMSDLSLIIQNDPSIQTAKDRGPEAWNTFINDFNKGNPSKAVMRAIEAKLISPDCDDVAKALLANEKRLNKTAVGNYLGEG